jgi:uncharacterized protein (DUF934 family)
MQLLTSTAAATSTPDVGADHVLSLPNDVDPTDYPLQGVQRIELHFPKFTDGRAYSQAVMLRRRCGFQGDIRAVGDVLIDQVQQMARSGFSSAVLREDQSLGKAQAQLHRYADFYQGDALKAQPRFARA